MSSWRELDVGLKLRARWGVLAYQTLRNHK